MAHILIAEDEKNVQKTISITLGRAGFSVDLASSGEEAIEKISQNIYDAVITDLRMGEVGGLEVLRAVKGSEADTEVVVMSAYGTIDTAVQAMREGAHDYLEKPFTPDQLLHTVNLALQRQDLKSEVKSLKRRAEDPNDPDRIIGSSGALREVMDVVDDWAQSDSPVLITGETGTGKDLLASTIQRKSQRADRPYVVVNCATIPKSLFESELFGHVKGAFSGAMKSRKGLAHEAHKGTLFLDEIGEMPLDVQPQLLRFLENGEIRPVGQNSNVNIDVRVIAATNRDLRSMVNEKTFRADLYYRLDVLRLNLPPLRDRTADIQAIAERFLSRLAKRMGRAVPELTPPAIKRLESYDWPGNIRELQNVIERAFMLARGKAIQAKHLLMYSTEASENKADGDLAIGDLVTASEIEKAHILAVLKNCGGNQRKSARILNISKSTLWRKLKEYGVEASAE